MSCEDHRDISVECRRETQAPEAICALIVIFVWCPCEPIRSIRDDSDCVNSINERAIIVRVASVHFVAIKRAFIPRKKSVRNSMCSFYCCALTMFVLPPGSFAGEI